MLVNIIHIQEVAYGLSMVMKMGTLNGITVVILRYTTNLVATGANYVTVVEVRPTLFETNM